MSAEQVSQPESTGKVKSESLLGEKVIRAGKYSPRLFFGVKPKEDNKCWPVSRCNIM